MDAEIRRLTYIQRHAGIKPRFGAVLGPDSLIGELPPFLRNEEGSHPAARPAEMRLETKIVELERKLIETEQRHQETLASLHQHAAEHLVVALRDQADTLGAESAAPVAAALATFNEARAQYFAEAESAIVRLALRIAARVLHREAQMDPLLLRGPVRVALEDAQQNAVCVLEVAADKQEAWERWLSKQGTARVEVRGEPDADPGHCRLEIGASRADFSVGAQLAEIERGFFDLLQHRVSSADEEAE